MSFFSLTNGKKFDLSTLTAGLKLDESNEFLKKYDQNNNSIFDSYEIEQFKQDAQKYAGDDILDNNEAINWYANIMDMSIDKVKQLFVSNNKQDISSSFEQIFYEQSKLTANTFLFSKADEAVEMYKTAYGGLVSQGWNGIKNFLNTKNCSKKAYRQIANQYATIDLLETARRDGGVTQKDFINARLEHLYALLQSENLSEGEKTCIERGALKLSYKELDNLIVNLTNAEDEDYPQLLQETLKDLYNKNTDNPDSIKFKTTNLNSVGAMLNSDKAEEPISYEQVYKLLTKTEFNPEKIEKYHRTVEETENVIQKNNEYVALNKRLQKTQQMLEASILYQKSSANMDDEATEIGNRVYDVGECYTKASSVIILALANLYSSKEQLIQEIKKITSENISIENGEVLFDGKKSNDKLVSLSKTLQDIYKEKQTQNLDGKSIEDYLKTLAKDYTEAYGMFDITAIAEDFANSQATGVMGAKMIAQVGGMLLVMSTGGAILPLFTMAGTALLSPGISVLEASTKNDGMSEEDKEAIKQELLFAGIFSGEGMVISKASQMIRFAVAKSCPKLLAAISEYGSDMIMSIGADWITTGEIDLSAETFGELLNIVTGVITHHKMSKTMHQKPSGVHSKQSDIAPKHDYVIQWTSVVKVLNADDGTFVVKIGDKTIAAKDMTEVNQIISEKAPKGTTIDMTESHYEDDICASPHGLKNQGYYLEKGKMAKNVGYEMNMDRLPILNMAESEIIDLNLQCYAKQIYGLKEGQSLIIGKKGDILTNQNNSFVSRQHVIVYKENGKLIIKDISSNGTEIVRDTPEMPITKIQSGSMEQQQSYLLDQKHLPEIRLADKVSINLQLYKYQIDSLQEGQILTIGREGNIKVEDPFVSATHVIIYKSNGQLKIKDVSTNGTTVKSKKNIFSKVAQLFSQKLTKIKLSTEEAQILEKFKNIPEIAAIMHDDVQTKKLVSKINKIINDPNIVPKEIKNAIESNSAYFKEGQINCKVTDNVMSEIAKIAKTGDYIFKFNTTQQAYDQTQVGDVAKVQGKLYVNNGYLMEPINLSEQKFRELFPPVRRFSIHQGSVGTCYLVSTLDSLYNSPKGRVEIYRMIGEDDRGIYTKTANSNGQKTYFKRWDRFKKHLLDENGFAIIEQGYCKNFSRSAMVFNPSETVIMELNSGGWANNAVAGLLGKTSSVTNDVQQFVNFIRQYANDSNFVINCATKGGQGLSDRNALNKQYNLYARHEYSIKGYDINSDSVLISNPWHTGVTTTIPLAEFVKYFSEVSYIQL